jgi:hypothetical protein
LRAEQAAKQPCEAGCSEGASERAKRVENACVETGPDIEAPEKPQQRCRRQRVALAKSDKNIMNYYTKYLYIKKIKT